MTNLANGATIGPCIFAKSSCKDWNQESLEFRSIQYIDNHPNFLESHKLLNLRGTVLSRVLHPSEHYQKFRLDFSMANKLLV